MIRRGIGVSPGIAIAKVLVLEGHRLPASRLSLAEEAIRDEMERFRRAMQTAAQELARLTGKMRTPKLVLLCRLKPRKL